MPVLVNKSEPITLRQFAFHGVDLEVKNDDQATGDCLFCGREGKFGVKVSSGEWRCYVCDVKGNMLTFLRELWRLSDERTNGESNVLAQDRGLLYPETVTRWGAAVSIATGQWILPGYDHELRIVQLYKYGEAGDGKRRLWPTPGMHHGLHILGPWDPAKPKVDILEGPWDGMALGEMLEAVKVNSDGRVVLTGNKLTSLLSDRNVCAVPGCGSIGEPFKKWLSLFADKDVTVWTDNDHPRRVQNRVAEPAGFAAVKRAAKLLTQGDLRAAKVSYKHWGDDGYNLQLKSGYDVRDSLTEGRPELLDRVLALENLLNHVRPVPMEWLDKKAHKSSGPKSEGQNLTCLPCENWSTLIGAWSVAMRWRQELDDVFSVMLAVALSTKQVGDQLFLQVIGDAGSGKTRLCDGMLVSKNCFALEHLTGFHSGWNDGSGEDFSLLARINHKTLITPEGDVLISSPRFMEIMSQQRRIFDGTSGATFKNKKEDTRYTGLRTPWIMAGTLALLDCNQSRLGDRFLRIFINPPDAVERQAILRHVAMTAMDAVLVESDGQPESHIEERLCNAYRLTGGYVDWLRYNSNDLIASVQIENRDEFITRISKLAEFTAAFRSRPDPDHRKESVDATELPTRLTHQYTRLARCLAAVLGKKTIDAEVMRRIKKVAMDTAKGRTLDIARHVFSFGDKGITVPQLSHRTQHTEDKDRYLLAFLRRLKVLESFEPEVNGLTLRTRWRLTPQMRALWVSTMAIRKG